MHLCFCRHSAHVVGFFFFFFLSFNTLFLSFTAVLSLRFLEEGTRNFPSPPPPTMHSLPIYQQPPPE